PSEPCIECLARRNDFHSPEGPIRKRTGRFLACVLERNQRSPTAITLAGDRSRDGKLLFACQMQSVECAVRGQSSRLRLETNARRAQHRVQTAVREKYRVSLALFREDATRPLSDGAAN